jgi:predicted phage baseplate assembly protein
MDFSVRQEEMPLDREVENVGAGNTVILQAVIATLHSGWVNQSYTLVGRVASVANRTFTFASVTGPSTVLTLEENLLTLLGDHPTYDAFRMDLRTLNFHLARGEALRLKAKDAYVAAASGTELAYYGTADEVSAVKDRRAMFVFTNGESKIVQATGLGAGALAEPDEARHRRVVFDTAFEYSRFLHIDPQATVYGNLISATQGKTEAEAAIGGGDQRRAFQTFAVPKAPLTYLLDETQTPAQVPELHVYVDGIEWKRVESFFNAGSGDSVYIVREDEEGKSFVQFGDGKTGRLLPSGRNNVTAVFRVGQGAHGELKEGTTPQATGKLANFDKLFLPAPVTGGSAPEEAGNARIAAPGRMQSLGRMVSLADIEAEALAIPHVIKARAVWSAPEGVPLVRLTVLTESGSVADAQAVRDTIGTFNRCRGPARFPIDVVQGIRQYVYIYLEAGFEAARREEDVAAAIQRAIGLAGEEGNGIDGSEGLFGLKTRTFGQGAHPSQVIGAAQNAAGVTWVKLKAAQAIDLGTPPESDPAELAKPSVHIVTSALACPEERLLALHAAHFTLSLSKDEVARECEA